MKKLLITLSILISLGMISPGIPLLAQPAKAPHENPDKATGIFDGAWLLIYYGRSANQAVNGQYQSAQNILVGLEKIDAPDNIRYIINRYSTLNHNLFATLDNLELLLGETTELLARNHIEEARQNLDSSEGVLHDAASLLQDTVMATRSLGEKLGVFTVSADDRLSQAYTGLEGSMDRLADLIERFKVIRKDLGERYNGMTGLTPTTLSLYISPESAFVGDNITATGRLECAGGLPAGKIVSLVMENNPIASAKTGFDGSYSASINLPYIYKSYVILTAFYEPRGDDSDIFLASRSRSINMTSMFYPTRLEVTIPPGVYHGMPFTLSGEVNTDEGIMFRQVKVSMNDIELAKATVSGRFSFEVTPPPDATPGRQNLTITVEPEGRYSGVLKKTGVSLSIMPVDIQTKTPASVLLPGGIHVSGKVSNKSGPLADTPVVLTLGDFSTTVWTAPDGSFSGSIKLHMLPQDAPLSTNPFYVSAPSVKSPYDLSPINTHELEITAGMPGVTTVTRTVKTQVLTINPLSTCLIMAITATLVLVLYRKKRIQAMLQRETAAPEAARLVLDVRPAGHLPVPVLKLSGIKGRVLSAYRIGLTAVEKITGIIMAPSATLREFVQTARLPAPVNADRFAELTALAESTLYSAADTPDVIANRAEELADDLKEESRLGNP